MRRARSSGKRLAGTRRSAGHRRAAGATVDGDAGRTTTGQDGGALQDPLTPAVTLELNIPASLPEDYVPETGAAAAALPAPRRPDQLCRPSTRSGRSSSTASARCPHEVENLLYVVQVKVRAIMAGVEMISQEDRQLVHQERPA